LSNKKRESLQGKGAASKMFGNVEAVRLTRGRARRLMSSPIPRLFSFRVGAVCKPIEGDWGSGRTPIRKGSKLKCKKKNFRRGKSQAYGSPSSKQDVQALVFGREGKTSERNLPWGGGGMVARNDTNSGSGRGRGKARCNAK